MENPFSARHRAGLGVWTALILFAIVGSSLTRAGQSQLAPSHEAQLLSLRLVPQNITLWRAKASQRFLVLAQYGDGLERDVTSRSRFSLSDTRVAMVNETGRVVARADGQTMLTARFGRQVTEAEIRIEGSEGKRPFSFARDIGGIFTKHRCNSSDCHGSVKGKGGFKLSMNALYPRDDYQWILKGGTYQVLSAEAAGEKIPRIDLEEPEKSLLLKATFGVSHGGGQRFPDDSLDYGVIRDWIRQGAPYGEESLEQSVSIEQLTVFPQQAVLDLQGRQQLLVTAHLSNGRYEDVTDQVLYVSNHPEVVEVTPEGLVNAVKTGETAVMIRAAGQAISVGFGVIAQPILDYPEVPRRNFIDDYVFTKLRRFNTVPSPLSGDLEFLRRVCLDVAGTLPSPERVREFLASKDPQKRDRLIETLLHSPEYGDYWTWRFADFFRVSTQNSYGGHDYWLWIREKITQNQPYDQMARERISALGYHGPKWHYYGGSDLRPAQDLMAEQVRVFLGRRLDCAQCHNHPYENWSQNQYWDLAAFYGRLTHLGDLNFLPVVVDDPAGHGDLGQGAPLIHPRTKEEVQPRFLDGTLLPESERDDLRWKLAEWMTSPRNRYFAEAIVNRMWSYFLGRGIVHPVDDFRLTNPPTHPDLLKKLAQDFVEHNYDLKHLIRLITQSRTYQLSGTTNESNREDNINYSHALPRGLDAEVLLDAISQVSRVPEEFSGYPPGTRAIHLVTSNLISHFLDVYDRPNRLMVPEREVKANLAQALHLLVGKTYTSKLSQEGGRIDRLLKSGASDSQIIEDFYLAALSRFPTPEEQARLQEAIAERPSRGEAIEDLLWGIVSSREFAYNH